MKLHPTPQEILDACKTLLRLGDSIRIAHKKSRNGDNCSVGKDPCLSVVKNKLGYAWYCHRCKESGLVNELVFSSPRQVIKKMSAKNKEEAWKDKIKKQGVDLPIDFHQIGDLETDLYVPEKARFWLSDHGVSNEDVKEYNIGWSSMYNRVIIPLYNENRKLLGWVGRNVYFGTDEVKGAINTDKYLFKKDRRVIGRVLFVVPFFPTPFNNKNDSFTIYVEDVISAIRVNKATGMKTVALLNTYISDDLLVDNKANTNLFWLDDDQKVNVLETTKRCTSWGIKAHSVFSEWDPKKYFDKEIREKLTCVLVRGA